MKVNKIKWGLLEGEDNIYEAVKDTYTYCQRQVQRRNKMEEEYVQTP